MSNSEYNMKPKAYQNVECGNCGDPIEPGVWCGNDDCFLGNRDDTGPEVQEDTENTLDTRE